MPEISIIVPVYNVEKYFKNCIESILSQTFKDFELILVDDGSTDSSGNICDEYAKKDNRIKVIHQGNKGQASARNRGLDISRGKYIGFVDSDDTIHPRMYEILYDLIIKSNSDISFCSYKYTFSTDRKDNININIKEINQISNIQAISNLFDKNIGVKLVVPWNKLYNKELFKNIRFETGRLHEDEFMAHRILYNCKKITYVDNELYYYLQREGSTMSQVSYKRKVDKLLAKSDRMRFCNKVGLTSMSDNICKTYEFEFFNLYKQLLNEDSENAEFLKEIRRDFILNLYILLRQKDIHIKEKISCLIFAISPKVYRICFN